MNAMKFVDENLRGFDDEILNPQWLKNNRPSWGLD